MMQPTTFSRKYLPCNRSLSWRTKWQEALDHFAKAIASPLLPNFERVFALCAASQCWMQLGNEEKATEAITTAKGIAMERTERSHVELVEQSLPMYRSDNRIDRKENKPYVLVNNTGKTLITVVEATEAIDEALEKGYLVLDGGRGHQNLLAPMIRSNWSRA